MKKLVVLSGAGMSAESGISTFRDSGGLWEKYKIDDVATPDAWRKNPSLVLEFYNQRRKQLFEVSPNQGHIALATLENDYDVQIITQNVDDLHERAGSTKILHLHGELMKVRSTAGDEEVYTLSKDNYETHLGDTCPHGYQLRPHIVWFGEAVPEIENAIPMVESADIFLIIGTSLNVYPAAGLISYVRKDVPIYLIDPNEVAVNKPSVTIIQKGAGQGMEEFCQLIKQL